MDFSKCSNVLSRNYWYKRIKEMLFFDQKWTIELLIVLKYKNSQTHCSIVEAVFCHRLFYCRGLQASAVLCCYLKVCTHVPL